MRKKGNQIRNLRKTNQDISVLTQSAFTCSKLTIAMLEKGVKYV